MYSHAEILHDLLSKGNLKDPIPFVTAINAAPSTNACAGVSVSVSARQSIV